MPVVTWANRLPMFLADVGSHPIEAKLMAAKQAVEKPISLIDANIQSAVLTIYGLTALITDRISEATLDELQDKQTGGAKKPREFRDPEREWRDKLYPIHGTDLYGFPGGGLKQAIVAAGYRCLGEQMTRLRAMFTIPTELVVIQGSEPRMRRDPGRLQGKTLTPIFRPEFPVPWSADVPFKFNASLISLEQLANLVDLAGFSIGIGAWRPENDGSFGQFTVRRPE